MCWVGSGNRCRLSLLSCQNGEPFGLKNQDCSLWDPSPPPAPVSELTVSPAAMPQQPGREPAKGLEVSAGASVGMGLVSHNCCYSSEWEAAMISLYSVSAGWSSAAPPVRTLEPWLSNLLTLESLGVEGWTHIPVPHLHKSWVSRSVGGYGILGSKRAVVQNEPWTILRRKKNQNVELERFWMTILAEPLFYRRGNWGPERKACLRSQRCNARAGTRTHSPTLLPSCFLFLRRRQGEAHDSVLFYIFLSGHSLA